MLATWTIGLGSVMFTLIDRWIRDPLGPVYSYYAGGYYQMADSLACMIVAFSVYPGHALDSPRSAFAFRETGISSA
jgi:hypothetical protein